VVEYEQKLIYANEVIMGLESENRMIEIETASTRATIDA
jgi:hypothetical protein